MRQRDVSQAAGREAKERAAIHFKVVAPTVHLHALIKLNPKSAISSILIIPLVLPDGIPGWIHEM